MRGKEGRGVKFPSGFQLGRINSVLELTLTPSLSPLLVGPAHRPSYSPSQQGTERGRDCITVSLSWTKVAENGTIKARVDSKKGRKLSRGGQKQRKWETRSRRESRTRNQQVLSHMFEWIFQWGTKFCA